MNKIPNSNGIAFNAWFEGKELTFEAKFGKQYQQKINLKMTNIEYLPETSKCSKTSSTYHCVAQNFYGSNHSICSRPCVPFIYQHILNYGINNTLPLCISIDEVNCMMSLMLESILNSFQQCPSSCKQSEYYGGYHRKYTTLYKYSDIETKWTIAFSSNRITFKKESLVFDEIAMIVYVGGVFGLSIGFSFYDTTIKVIQQFNST